MTGRLLLLTHNATRTGSNRVLLDLLDATEGALPAPLAMQVGPGGPLVPELQRWGAPLERGERPGAVLANTVLAAHELGQLPRDVPRAVYVHEPAEIVVALPTSTIAEIAAADLVLCVSEQTADTMVALGVDSAAIVVVPPIVARRPWPSNDAVEHVRRALLGSSCEHLVIGCGEAVWRKGPDLFLEVARSLRDRPDLRFAWIGRRPPRFGTDLDQRAAAMGIADRISWPGEVIDPQLHLAAASVLVAPSRYDPMPLVPLEAAFVGTPTVAFGVDGLASMAHAGAVAAAPYPDTLALSTLVRAAVDQPGISHGLVDAACRWADERQAAAVVVPPFVAALELLLAGRRRGANP